MLFVFLALFAAIALAVSNDCNRADCSKSKAFAGFYNVMVAIVLSVGGTNIFRRHQTEMGIGVLLGVLTMMAWTMGLFFIVTAGMAQQSKSTGKDTDGVSPEGAYAAFSFLLFCLYSGFTVLLWKYRDEIIKRPYSPGTQNAPQNSSSPPPGMVRHKHRLSTKTASSSLSPGC
jgi:hypothetical protein